MKEKLYKITLTEEQLKLIAECVEDGSEVKTLRIHEVDLIAESVNDSPKAEPNWEQRRYEIAKDCLAGYTSNSSDRIMNANVLEQIETSIKIADGLIDKLKGGKK